MNIHNSQKTHNCTTNLDKEDPIFESQKTTKMRKIDKLR